MGKTKVLSVRFCTVGTTADRVANANLSIAAAAVAAVVADLTVHRKVNPKRLDLHDVIGHDDVDPARHLVSGQVHVLALVVEHNPEQL